MAPCTQQLFEYLKEVSNRKVGVRAGFEDLTRGDSATLALLTAAMVLEILWHQQITPEG